MLGTPNDTVPMRRNLKRKELLDDSQVSPVILKRMPECQENLKLVHERTLALLAHGAKPKPALTNVCYLCSKQLPLIPCPCCDHPICSPCIKQCRLCERSVCSQCLHTSYEGSFEVNACWECHRNS